MPQSIFELWVLLQASLMDGMFAGWLGQRNILRID